MSSHFGCSASPSSLSPRSATPGRAARFLGALSLTLAASTVASAQLTSEIPGDLFARSDFRYVGPVGNRVSAVTGEPGNINVYYLGAASGGVFKSEDAGHSWRPIFDDQAVQSIGALAVAPSDANVVWAGTGEAFIRSNVSIGDGVYRSTDGGDNWEHMGLAETGRVGRIVIHPTNPDIVFVAAAGHMYGPQEERGLFRTTDGGDTWERVLFAGPNSGAIDVVMNPSNPRILFAATWQMQIWTWGRESGGPESGLWTSRDGGDSWTRLSGNGLPRGTMGRIGLGMTPDDPEKVYALIETNSNRDFAPLDDHEGTLWRSDNGGRAWSMVNADHALAQRPLYYSRLAVSPDDADEVHFMSTVHTKSLDGGATFSVISGGDNHDMWIDPLMPDRMIVGYDQGVKISTNRGRGWYRPQLPIAQMYHVFTDTEVPYNLYGNRQDGGSSRGPSNTLSGGGIPIGAWKSVGGCESGFAVPDTVTNDVVWSGCYEGILERHEISTGITRTVSVWPDNPEGWAAGDVRYRFQWTFPVHISPHDNETVYAGSQHVHRTRDGGQSWMVISPDLTRNDVSKQQKTGGLTTEDVSPTFASVLYAIAESPIEAGVIWTGSNDGLVQITRDGGSTWTDVTANMPGLPEWGTVNNIEPSRFDAAAAYVTVDLHQLGDNEPYIYKTEDYGASWRSLARDVPRSVFGFARVIHEDPTRAGLLYLGTENSIFVSFDDGRGWTPLQGDLPHAPVYWLTVQPHFNDLVVGTYGRGFWILDDISAIQRMSDEVLASAVHLFEPRPAYRFVSRAGRASQPGDPAAGENPDEGASINFFFQSVPSGPATVLIETEAGELVRTLPIRGARAGLNRVMWNLRYEASSTPRIRTPAVEHSHVDVGPNGWRTPPDGSPVRPTVIPGRYRVRLLAGGEEHVTWLEVLQDPASGATVADMRAQLDLQLDLREMSDSSAALIDRIEWARKGLMDLEERLQGETGYRDVVEAGEELERALIDLEMGLFDLRLSGGAARQDTIRWPRQLWAKIASLAGYSSGSDDRPTDQMNEVRDQYREQIAEQLRRWIELAETDIAQFNRLLAAQGLPPIISQQ
ncbi:MAG: sialidase [Gemmatimonadetes bacterium]|nr:sialidase [Gemmatimonadota bacterium]MDA1104573.1 sialidase [Gemmatimonadota bacterium]